MTDRSRDAPEPESARSQSKAETMRAFGALGSVGLSFVLAIVLGTWGGWALDRWLGTTPWLFLLGFAVGLAAGILNVVRTARRFIR